MQEIVQEIVVTLLCDRDNNIRRMLVHNGLPRLCVFFGRQKGTCKVLSSLNCEQTVISQKSCMSKCFECFPFFFSASDVLVSHLITFLNDKNDWRLRASFYECVPALAAYIGWQSTLILKPLLHQVRFDLFSF